MDSNTDMEPIHDVPLSRCPTMTSVSQLRHQDSLASMSTKYDPASATNSTTKLSLSWLAPVKLTPRSQSLADFQIRQEEEGKHSSDDKSSSAPLDHAARQRLLRKLDRRLLPILFFTYILSFVDRTNISIARSEGLEASLKMSGLDYNKALGIFYIFYFIAEVPSNLILKKTSARNWFTIIILSYGFIVTMQGFTKTYSGLLASRSFLGLAQGCLFPGVAFYYTTWYSRYEIGFRIAVFFSSAPFAGAIGGFLALGISRLDGAGGLQAWQWIFIIEGLMTIVVGCLSYFFIVDSPATAKFLTEDEKAELRRKRTADAATGAIRIVEWKHVLQALKDFKIYANMLQALAVWAGIYSISIFLPAIIKELGYSSYTAQLLAVPVYLWAIVTTLSGSFLADRCQQRGVFILGFEVLALVGYLMLRLSDDLNIQYAGTFFAAGGIYPLVPLVGAWNSNNLVGSTKRAVGIGMQIGFGNLGGLLSAFIYLNQDAPRYKRGHDVLISLVSLNIAIATFMTIWLRRENARRARALKHGYFAPDTIQIEEREKGDYAVNFVYVV